ncbi:MAG: hypothetical protein MR487_11380, partial [Lachnospiraceae bacterium]|nr:hypothetical protein [Lachnospiraceae bacterium]
MIQDIMPSVYHVEYRNVLPVPDACLIGVEGRSIYMKKVGEQLEFLHFSDLINEKETEKKNESFSMFLDAVHYL